MKSEVKTVKLTRLFNKALICNNLKRFWWVSLLYTIGLFLLSPLLVLTNINRSPVTTIEFNNIFDGTICFLFIVPVFLAVIVFRYMQNPKSMVTVHTMPYSRLDLYVNNVISGLILLIVPILLNTALLSYIELFVTNGILFEAGIIMKCLWISLLVSITLFSITVAVGMVTGSSIAQIIFTYIINFLPAGIIVILNFLLNGIIYGFTGVSEDNVNELAKLSPIVQTLFLSRKDSLNEFLVPDIVLIVLTLVIGYFIYKYRNLEDAGEVISGKFIKPIFKYGVTVCVMLVGVIYVKGIFEVENPNFLVYILFALFGYVVAEMLLKKSFKVLNSYKGFIGFVGVFAIVVACVHFDVFGYESFVPKAQDIECFTLGSSKSNIETYKYSGNKAGVLTSDENIGRIVNINKAIVANKEENRKEEDIISINYLLNNGKIISRTYKVNELKYEDELSEICQSNEYKQSKIELFSRKAEEVESILISNNLFSSKTAIIINKEELLELIEAVKKDVLSDSYKGEYYNYGYITPEYAINKQYRINIMYRNENSREEEYYTSETLYFNRECINVYNFIESKAQEVQVKSEEIEEIEIYGSNDEVVKIIQNKAEIEKVLTDITMETISNIMGDTEDEIYQLTMKAKFIDGTAEWIDLY